MTRLAIFDCDGTLVDSQATICDAMEHTFAGAGLAAPDRAAVRRIVGLSLPQAMRALLPGSDDAHHHALADAYKASFISCGSKAASRRAFMTASPKC